MIVASIVAAKERMNKLAARLSLIESVGVGMAIVLAVAAAAAVRADAAGQKWPTVITSLIAAGLVVSLLGAGCGWVIGGQATALARRIDVASSMGEQAMQQARVLVAQQEAMYHTLRMLLENDRALIAELGRIRAVERERLEDLADLRRSIIKTIGDARWQGYTAAAQDMSGGGGVTPLRR